MNPLFCRVPRLDASSRTNTMPETYQRRGDSDAEDDDELFAELEAELENDENEAVREKGLEQLKKQ